MKAGVRVGLLTIGQAPRDDVVPELRAFLGPEVEVVERGALDSLSPEEIAALAPSEGEEVLATRLRTGEEVLVGKRAILPLIEGQLRALEMEVSVLALLCSGTFPRLRARRPLLLLDALLYGFLSAIALEGQIGVLVPVPQQIPAVLREFAAQGLTATAAAASPYGPDPQEAVSRAARQLADRGAELLVLNCIGYDLAMKRRARAAAGKPVVLVRSLLARGLGELI